MAKKQTNKQTIHPASLTSCVSTVQGDTGGIQGETTLLLYGHGQHGHESKLWMTTDTLEGEYLCMGSLNVFFFFWPAALVANAEGSNWLIT